jgi:hypothetical protein
MDLAAPGFIGTVPKATGRPGYAPADLLKLYIYGYLNWVRSSRTVLHGSAGGRSEPILACVQAMRTDFGRPSSGMRFKTATATVISVA